MTAGSAPSSSMGGSSCTNALQEVMYNVYINVRDPDSKSKTAYYSISKVVADIVVIDSIAANTEEMGFVSQTYSINFFS
jgi:hypothetical protein